MEQSKKSAKKTVKKKNVSEEPVENVAAKEMQQQNKHKKTSIARRIAVQYTPRIPTVRCPWC